MLDDATLIEMKGFFCRYLLPLAAGPWTIHGACINARTETSYLVTADSQVVRLLIDKPDEGWAVAFEVVQRGGSIQRLRVEGFDGVTDAREGDRAWNSYLQWLNSVTTLGSQRSDS